MEVVASVCQGRTAAAQCGLFTKKSVPVIFEPPCNLQQYIIAVHVGHYMVFKYATLIVEVTRLPALSGFQRCI